MTENKFEYFYNRVADWHRIAVGQDKWQTQEHINLAWNLVREEHLGPRELLESYQAGNEEGILDGLCDCFVVVVGLVEALRNKVEYGVQNYSRVPLRKYLNIAIPIIQEHSNPMVFDLMASLTKCLDITNLPIEEGMMAVLDSNDSKFPPVADVKAMYGDNIEEALASASDWIESQGRYKGVVGAVVNDRCVFRDENGKVMKWAGFIEPNLQPILDKFWENN